jgi:hypothetical protein
MVAASVQVSPLPETAGWEVRADMSMVRRDISTRVDRGNGGGLTYLRYMRYP